jgi:hypothetical protein
MSFLFPEPNGGKKHHKPRKKRRAKPGFDEDGNPLPIRDPNGRKPTCPSGFIINNDFSPFDPINPPYRCKVDKDPPDIDYEKAGQKQFRVKEPEPIEPEVEVLFAEETNKVSVQEVKANSQKNVKEANAEAAKRRKKYGFSGGGATRRRKRSRKRKPSNSSAKSKRCRSKRTE